MDIHKYIFISSAFLPPNLLERACLEDVEVGVEGRHHLARVGLDEAGEGGDRSGHLGLGEEAHDANHGEAAVVDLGKQARLLFLLGHLRR